MINLLYLQWLGDGSEINTHIVDTLIQKLVLLLTTSNMDLIGQDGDEQTTKDTESHSNSHDSSQASERSAEDERKMESECKTGRAFNHFPVILDKFHQFFHLLTCFGSLYCKQNGPRSDCS